MKNDNKFMVRGSYFTNITDEISRVMCSEDATKDEKSIPKEDVDITNAVSDSVGEEDVSTEQDEEKLNIYMENLTECCIDAKITETKLVKNYGDLIFANLYRIKTDSIVLTGPTGSGVTTLIKYIAKLIATEKCPDKFKGAKVFKILRSSFPSDEACITVLTNIFVYFKSLKIEKLIIVFDDFQNMPDYLMHNFKETFDGLKEVFEFELFKIIVGVDYDFFQDENGNANKNQTLNFAQSSVTVQVAMKKQIPDILKTIKPAIEELSEKHSGIKISQSVLERFGFLVYSGDSEFINYELLINRVDYLLSYAEIRGAKRVSEVDIKKHFEVDFKKFEALSDSKKRGIAKHEIGHTILALKYPQYVDFIGVKISGNWQIGANGLTLVYYKELTDCEPDFDYIVSKVAFFLAGRIGEENKNVGAGNDLIKAKEMAEEWVYNSGTSEKLGLNYYVKPDGINSEEVITTCEEEIQDILNQGEALAKKVLSEEKEVFDELVETVLKKIYLTNSDVMRIWNKYHKS